MRMLALAALPLAIAGPTTTGSAAGMAAGASATLTSSDGAPRGTATVRQEKGSLKVHVTAEGLPAGVHGIHIHATGRCEGPDFKTAGAHWNPTGHQHGRDNPQGAHQGDLPNITIGSDGKGKVDFKVKGGTLASLMDADGAAVVIHASADDYKTDPSGNSGGRIACGVLTKG